jgi:hypothetical protein
VKNGKAFFQDLKEDENHHRDGRKGGNPDEDFCDILSEISYAVDPQRTLLRDRAMARELRIMMIKKRIIPVAKRA